MHLDIGVISLWFSGNTLCYVTIGNRLQERPAPLTASLEAPAAVRGVVGRVLLEVDVHDGRLVLPPPSHPIHQRSADEEGLGNDHCGDEGRRVPAVWPEDVVEGGCQPDRYHDYRRHLGCAH